MCDDNDEILLRYHFGDMAPEEQAAFERRLRDEPKLAERLEKLRECIAVNGVAGCTEDPKLVSDVPKELADRTAHAIMAGQWERATECVGRKRFCLVEVIAFGVAATLLGAMIFPAIEASRESSRRIACTNNLLEIYQSLDRYQAEHGARFPEIAPTQNAGLFTVALADGGYIDRNWLREVLVCPSSDLSSQISHEQAKVVVPTREELQAALEEQLWLWRRFMAGSYAYRIGYIDGGVYVFPKCQTNCRTALMADAPARRDGDAVVSRNHGDCGQNVLFEDGHVAFMTGCWAPDETDHLYLNDVSQIAAGRHRNDIVLAPSEATPLGVRIVTFGF